MIGSDTNSLEEPKWGKPTWLWYNHNLSRSYALQSPCLYPHKIVCDLMLALQVPATIRLCQHNAQHSSTRGRNDQQASCGWVLSLFANWLAGKKLSSFDFSNLCTNQERRICKLVMFSQTCLVSSQVADGVKAMTLVIIVSCFCTSLRLYLWNHQLIICISQLCICSWHVLLARCLLLSAQVT